MTGTDFTNFVQFLGVWKTVHIYIILRDNTRVAITFSLTETIPFLFSTV